MVLTSLLLVLALTGCGLWGRNESQVPRSENAPTQQQEESNLSPVGETSAPEPDILEPIPEGTSQNADVTEEVSQPPNQMSDTTLSDIVEERETTEELGTPIPEGDTGMAAPSSEPASDWGTVPSVTSAPEPPQPVIVIDPGHAAKAYTGTEPLGPGASEQKQKSTGGTSGAASGLMEHELNLTIALQLRDELTARGYAVVLTRETADVQISNAERAQIANDYDADVYLRIHANGAENSAVNGAMTICTTSKNPFVPQMYAENYRLSECVLNAYCEVTGTKKERIWETDSMSGNNWSNVPTTMIEMGYMTNHEEDLRMADPDHQRLMVQGIADGIDAYLSVSGGRVQ